MSKPLEMEETDEMETNSDKAERPLSSTTVEDSSHRAPKINICTSQILTTPSEPTAPLLKNALTIESGNSTERQKEDDLRMAKNSLTPINTYEKIKGNHTPPAPRKDALIKRKNMLNRVDSEEKIRIEEDSSGRAVATRMMANFMDQRVCKRLVFMNKNFQSDL